jgi:hypothetical protein
MVPTLLPTPRIQAGGLQVSTPIRADPNIRPRRWNYQRADPLQNVLVPNGLGFGIEIPEAFSRLPPPDSRLRIGDIPQSCFLRRKHRISHNFWQSSLLQWP